MRYVAIPLSGSSTFHCTDRSASYSISHFLLSILADFWWRYVPHTRAKPLQTLLNEHMLMYISISTQVSARLSRLYLTRGVNLSALCVSMQHTRVEPLTQLAKSPSYFCPYFPLSLDGSFITFLFLPGPYCRCTNTAAASFTANTL